MTQLRHFPTGSDLYIEHPALARPGISVFPDKLYFITVLENPLRWRSRYLNYHEFELQIKAQGGILITVELAYGQRAFEVTESGNPFHVQVRTRDELFHKENLYNLGTRVLPLGVNYVAMGDCDMLATRQDWMQETLHQLQHYDAVQMYSNYSAMTSDHRVSSISNSFMWNYWNVGDIQPPKDYRGWQQWWEGYGYGYGGQKGPR